GPTAGLVSATEPAGPGPGAPARGQAPERVERHRRISRRHTPLAADLSGRPVPTRPGAHTHRLLQSAVRPEDVPAPDEPGTEQGRRTDAAGPGDLALGQ